MIVAPEGPAVGQAHAASQAGPDGQPWCTFRRAPRGPHAATSLPAIRGSDRDAVAHDAGTSADMLYALRRRQRGSVEMNRDTRPRLSTTRTTGKGGVLPRMRPAGFEPATKGFKGPRVSARLGLSHPPQVGPGPAESLSTQPSGHEAEAGRRGGDYGWDSPR